MEYCLLQFCSVQSFEAFSIPAEEETLWTWEYFITCLQVCSGMSGGPDATRWSPWSGETRAGRGEGSAVIRTAGCAHPGGCLKPRVLWLALSSRPDPFALLIERDSNYKLFLLLLRYSACFCTALQLLLLGSRPRCWRAVGIPSKTLFF